MIHMTNQPPKISLELFAVVWNQIQNQTTPPIHLRILGWLERSWQTSDSNLLLMAFRSCGKSTLVGIFCAWLLYHDPNLRIMVLAADSLLARKMVRNVKRIIERHPLTVDLKPDRLDQWASDRFTVNRTQELRDASMLARGISSNITGSRADIVIYDDVEVPNTCMSMESRIELRERLTESCFILTAGGTQLYVGTPHTYDTIYAVDNDTQNLDQSDAFLNGFSDLRVPIIRGQGAAAWPEKYTIDDIIKIKRQVGPNKFASQMMLEPVNIAEGRLNVGQLRFYEGDLDYTEAQQKPVLTLNGKRLVSCSSYWDPAFGSATGDASVWAVIFTDEDGKYYLQHLEYIRVTASDDEDEASQQCKIIASLCKQFYVPSMTVEINGIGRFLPAILKREMRTAGVACAVIEQSSRVPKSQRILEGFDAVLAAHALNVNKSVKQTPFLTEMREWKPSATNARDDALDAVAGALLQEPIRMGARSNRTSKRHTWQGHNGSFKAKF
jgi:phage terminase large subunit-like protein